MPIELAESVSFGRTNKWRGQLQQMGNTAEKPDGEKANLNYHTEQISLFSSSFKEHNHSTRLKWFVILLCEPRQLEVPFCYLPTW